LGSVVIPRDPALWPRLRTGPGSAVYFGFLTLSPAEMQSAAADEVGDVCYVEYAVLPSTNGGGLEVRRLFWPSAKTFSDILSSGSLPGIQSANQFESLGLNLLPTNSMAARGLGPLATEVSKTNFILLGTNMLPLVGSPGLNNYPAAIEVNLAVADPDTLANSNIIASDKYILRNAGLYSFRIPLPKPPDVP
jgi:hypothetical protein